VQGTQPGHIKGGRWRFHDPQTQVLPLNPEEQLQGFSRKLVCQKWSRETCDSPALR
jgi:hypothetical protein